MLRMYNPDLKKVRCCENKTECGNLLILCFKTSKKKKSIETVYLMFYLINFIDLCKHIFILNLISAKCFNQGNLWASINWESC